MRLLSVPKQRKTSNPIGILSTWFLRLRAASALVFFIASTVANAYETQVRGTSCDLASGKNFPTIHMIGEHHFSPQSIETRHSILLDSVKGLYPVASEIYGREGGNDNAFFPHQRAQVTRELGGQLDSSKLYGIESSIPFDLLNSFDLQYELIGGIYPSHAVFVILKWAKNSPLIYKAVEQLSLKDSGNPLALRLFAQSALIAIDSNSSEEIRRLIDQLHFEQSYAFSALHHLAVIDLANKNFLHHFNGVELRPTLSGQEAWEDYMATETQSGQYYDLITRARDRDFANSIGDLICKFSGKEEKLVVIVGAGHMDGVTTHLQKMASNKLNIKFYRSDLDPRINIDCEVRDTCPNDF